MLKRFWILAVVLVCSVFFVGCPQYGDPLFSDVLGEPSSFESRLISLVIEQIGTLIGIDLDPVNGRQDSGQPISRVL